ncbi:MAG: hypothetical protein A7316_01475 [Candidatus Altiarchaeales archaeon WOR_SM1_86-2]|nr:MAG: hypothetical protein A7316_01475 [Candidatus Altiarchaeales archaeon WOR_SM1_86-2]
MYNLKFLAKYPFLREAKQWVESLGLGLEEIENHPLYSASMDLGKQRVLDAIKSGRAERYPSIDDELVQELTVLSYPIARVIANLTNSKRIIDKYAWYEANLAYRFLKDEPDFNIKKIMDEVNLDLENDRIHFLRYLQLSSSLAKSQPRWKLVNRQLNSGYVRINKREVLLMLREGIRQKVTAPINLTGAPESFKRMATEIKIKTFGAQELKVEKLDKGALPPCILNMLSQLESGEISHNGMFVLGTFLVNLNLTIEDILKIFSVFPKYDEEKTRKQLEYFSGEKTGRKYSCPACATIKSYGLCPGECGVNHPLNYYLGRVRKGGKR